MDDTAAPLIIGERIHLRRLTLNDVGEAYLRWMNDPEVTRFTESRFSRQTLESLRTFVNASQGPKSLLLAIVEKASGRHIGNIKLDGIHPIHKFASIGIIIGEKDCWGKGYATEAVRLIRDYAFTELKLQKLCAGCYEGNLGSVRAFERAGFFIEGQRRGQVDFDGRRIDVILLGCLPPPTDAGTP